MIEWPTPQNVHDVILFLGLASYYQQFVRGFSQIFRPLNDPTKAKVKWNWGNKEENNYVQ